MSSEDFSQGSGDPKEKVDYLLLLALNMVKSEHMQARSVFDQFLQKKNREKINSTSKVTDVGFFSR